jgi:predicted Zn-dependent peptidase
MNEQTTDAQAEELVRAQIFAGDWRMARTLLDKVRAVSPADVQAFARKYIGKLQMVVLGDPGKIDPQLFGSL